MDGTAVIRATCLAAGAVTLLANAAEQPSAPPELLDVRSGGLTLRAQVWRPSQQGQFPAVLFSHGSYSADDPLPLSDAATIGSVFARHGYIFLWLHRQGIGLSSDQGIADGDQMANALRTEGVAGRNRMQLQLLETDELNEDAAALAQLRGRRDVDTRRIALVGHSFGGSLSILLAARDPAIRAIVVFGGAARSWNESAELRQRLLAAIGQMSAAALFIHATNDYSTAPGRAFDAEMERLGKPHVLRIYPPFGPDTAAGHNLIFHSVGTWESDVFTFLDDHLPR